MSGMSLWTPDGERPVPPANSPGSTTPPTPPPGPDLSPEQTAQAEAMAHELAEARNRILETEVGTVLANHAMGIYELAAIHLTADEPKLDQAKTAIDALRALLAALEGRLGAEEATLKEALHYLQMAFVERSEQLKAT